ncbi:hypothetical protein WJX84_011144 [Apatococcus fuscideae]|uniref:Methionine aminopeptidase n=1 Tax=Apatococcus fuscideae TaxID=2026836 RepID=A0AAW1TDP7_9CHLO
MAESQDPSSGLPCDKCGKPAKLSCPKCLELKLPREGGAFCSQECFKEAWGQHKKVHKVKPWLYVTNRGQGRTQTMPSFPWTGELRPDLVGPRRLVPASIPLPEYAETSIPKGEQESRQQTSNPVRTPKQIEGLRKACRIARDILDKAHAAVRPGVTTDEIDRVVHEATLEAGAYPSPLNYFSFPKSVCTSVNEVVCHGIPDQRPLQSGDIVNVDVTAYYKGYHGDLNETFVVGEVDSTSKQLLKVTYECLERSIAAVKPGMRYRDLGKIISQHAQGQGFSVITTYCGHGIGEWFHCAPTIPHYHPNKAVGIMKEGHTFTIEPMINVGKARDVTWPDGWTSVTRDGSRSAQYEHTMVVTATGCEVLTARLPTSPPLWWQVPEQQQHQQQRDTGPGPAAESQPATPMDTDAGKQRDQQVAVSSAETEGVVRGMDALATNSLHEHKP